MEYGPSSGDYRRRVRRIVRREGSERADVELTLIDQRNFHLFQPLLYQVATGELSPGDVAFPLRAVLSNQKNARVLMSKAVGLDASNRSRHA